MQYCQRFCLIGKSLLCTQREHQFATSPEGQNWVQQLLRRQDLALNDSLVWLALSSDGLEVPTDKIWVPQGEAAIFAHPGVAVIISTFEHHSNTKLEQAEQTYRLQTSKYWAFSSGPLDFQ